MTFPDHPVPSASLTFLVAQVFDGVHFAAVLPLYTPITKGRPSRLPCKLPSSELYYRLYADRS
jgi:hypothetical protein